MKRFQPEFLTLFLENIAELSAASTPDDDTMLSHAFRERQRTPLAGWRKACADIGLRTSVFTFNKLDKLLSRSDVTFGEFRQLLKELRGRLPDEMHGQLFLHIELHNAQYYVAPLADLDTVLTQFPSTRFDFEEAAKCLALNRSTGCVFHLMRVMEVGLRVLGMTLNDPGLDPRRNPTWDRILKKCRDELAKPLAERSPEWRADELFFSGAAARLMAVKDAWRNPTMHVEINYTEETALDVWNHVKSFMGHLATKLAEPIS